MKGHRIFLEESPETVDILFCSVEHKSGVYIADPRLLGYIRVPLANFFPV